MQSITTGVLLGRFLPPHNGHAYLVDFAGAYCDRLFIYVCSLRSEPIPGRVRCRWLQALSPKATIVPVTDEIPEAQRNAPNALEIWAQTIRGSIAGDIDALFGSEEYGWQLANLLGCRFVPVDPKRRQFPISASQILADPWRHWGALPAVVRADLVCRVALCASSAQFGLWKALYRRLATVSTDDWLHSWEQRGAHASIDAYPILRAQLANEDALAKQANRVLICRSHPLRIAAYWLRRFGAIPPPVREALTSRRYDLYLMEEAEPDAEERRLLDLLPSPAPQIASLHTAERAIEGLLQPGRLRWSPSGWV